MASIDSWKEYLLTHFSHRIYFHLRGLILILQTDFSGRVINNDHFLYWGDAVKTTDDGIEYNFHLVEQTEFLDDASFQPFKGYLLHLTN